MARSIKIDAGKLRDLVQLQKVTRTTNELGETVEAWADFGEQKWAQVTPVSAKERLRADAAVIADTTHIVTLRYFCGFNSTDFRIVFRGAVLDINGLIDIESRRVFWEASCNEGKI